MVDDKVLCKKLSAYILDNTAIETTVSCFNGYIKFSIDFSFPFIMTTMYVSKLKTFLDNQFDLSCVFTDHYETNEVFASGKPIKETKRVLTYVLPEETKDIMYTLCKLYGC